MKKGYIDGAAKMYDWPKMSALQTSSGTGDFLGERLSCPLSDTPWARGPANL